MGWTFTHRHKGISTLDFFKREFECENEHGKWSVLDCATKGGVAYLAMQIERRDDKDYGAYLIQETPGTYVIGVICLIKWTPKASDGYNFGWKDMTECMGPYRNECPQRILDLLSPVKPSRDVASDDRRQACATLKWRRACLWNIKRAKTMPKIGETITFAKPLHFGDGHSATKFTIEMWRGGSRKRGMRVYRSVDNGKLYRIGNVQQFARV